MRKPSPALLVTSVVIALTGSVAFAQKVTTPARAASTTIVTAPAPAASTTTTTLGNPTVLANSDGSTTSTTLNNDGTRTMVTTNVDGTTSTTTLPANLFNPAVINGAVGGVTLDGERLLDERDRALAIDRSAVSVDLASLGTVTTATADVQRSSVSLDRVIRQAERDRKKIGRNGQLLNTIAPRTNVDRSSEMPDDGPTPALSGLANSLSRR